MNLCSARIRNFRCIDDSGRFEIDQTTCLVGKNESGKTAILHALYRIKPSVPGMQFVPGRDFPKRRWLPNQPLPDEPVASTEWKLDAGEVHEFEQRFGPQVLKSPTFTIEIGYANQRTYSVDTDEHAAVRSALSWAVLTADEKKQLDAPSVDELTQIIDKLATRSEAVSVIQERLASEWPNGIRAAISAFLDSKVPTFLYFDSYSRLRGRVSLEQLLERTNTNKLTDSDHLFLALLKLAGTSPEQLHGASTFEEFNSSIRAVSINISNQIFEYWTQNQYLAADIKLDRARSQDPAPFNTGNVFHLRIDNARHRSDTSFDDRSTGFVWFFSFLIWFNDLRAKHNKNLVILLDEPGLTLHAKAQADLLRYIREKLAPYQVLYTTHSPFMIDPDRLMSARTVEDVVVSDKSGKEQLRGTQVRGDALSTDADTVSPLQRALDYELTQTLFIGRNTLLVEGPSEVLYFRWFSEQLRKRNVESLDYRWALCTVGGVDRIPGFVSLFRGNRLNIAAIVDVQENQKQRLENVERSLGPGRLLRLTGFVPQAEADIEDLVGRATYISIVAQAYRLAPDQSLPEKKPADAPLRVVKEVERHFLHLPPHLSEFDHFRAAEWLVRNSDASAQLPEIESAIDRFAKLVSEVNKLIAD